MSIAYIFAGGSIGFGAVKLWKAARLQKNSSIQIPKAALD